LFLFCRELQWDHANEDQFNTEAPESFLQPHPVPEVSDAVDEETLPVGEISTSFINLFKKFYPSILSLEKFHNTVVLGNGLRLGVDGVDSLLSERNHLKVSLELVTEKLRISEEESERVKKENLTLTSLCTAQENNIKILNQEKKIFTDRLKEKEEEKKELLATLEAEKIINSQSELSFQSKVSDLAKATQEIETLRASNSELLVEAQELRHFRDTEGQRVSKAVGRYQTMMEGVTKECESQRLVNSQLHSKVNDLLLRINTLEEEKNKFQALYNSTQARRASMGVTFTGFSEGGNSKDQ